MEEEKKFTIYLHRCPNGKCYVGMTSQKVINRWGYGGYKYKKNKDFYPDIEKYGWENIEHIILEEGLSKEDACESEKYNIKKFNCIYPNGYNIALGGEWGHNLGKHLSEETKRKISEANVGKHSGKRPSRTYKKGIKRNRPTGLVYKKNYVGVIHKNRPSGLVYKKKNKKETNIELNKIIKRRNRRKIKQFSIYGELIREYDSARHAERETSIDHGNILRCCNGKIHNIHNDKVFRFYDDDFLKYSIKSNSTIVGIKIVLDSQVFESIRKCEIKNNISLGLLGRYLSGKYPMPQKWLNRGLRYYNPETDKDLPIYQNTIDTKDEV